MDAMIKLNKGFNLIPDFEYYLDKKTSELYKRNNENLRKVKKYYENNKIFYKVMLGGKVFKFDKIKMLAMFKYTNDNYRYRTDMRAEIDDGSSYNRVMDIDYFYSRENEIEKITIDDISIGDVYTVFYYKYRDRLDEFLINAISLLEYDLDYFKESVKKGFRVYKRCDLSHYLVYDCREVLISSDGAILDFDDIKLLTPLKNLKNGRIRYLSKNMNIDVLLYENFYEQRLNNDNRFFFEIDASDVTDIKIN